MEKVVLLNSDYNFLGVVHWKKAIALMVKGKVEIVKEGERAIHNASRTVRLVIPKVIRLIKMARRIYKSMVPFSKRNVLVRDRNICQYCGEPGHNDLTIDHVIPISKGGKSTFDNCVASCFKCNSTKNDSLPSECGMTLLRKPFRPTIMEFITIKMRSLGIDELLKEIWEY